MPASRRHARVMLVVSCWSPLNSSHDQRKSGPVHYGEDKPAALNSAAGETLVCPRNGASITKINATTNPIAPMWKAISVMPTASSLCRPYMIIAPVMKTAITHQNTGGTAFVALSSRV